MSNNRNTSIEFLRVLMMFLIVLEHCFLFSWGGTHSLPKNDVGIIARILGLICYPSVNVLILISGYFTIGSLSGRFLKAGKFFKLYIQTLFYIISLCGIAYIAGFRDFHLSQWFPLKSSVYWFMTEYFKLMLISPFLVRFIDGIDKVTYSKLLLILFFLTVLLQIKGTEGGFSLISFIFLYFLAGYFKLYGALEKIKTTWILLLYMSSLVCLFFEFTFPMHMVSWLIPIGYNNIFVVFMSIATVLLILKYNGAGYDFKLINNISRLAPYTLGVYLIHEHPLVRRWLWDNVGVLLSSEQVLFAPLISLVVFLLCVLIEKLRQLMFEWFRINNLIDRLVSYF